MQLLAFEDNLLRCNLCKEQWFKENTLTSWYGKLNQWVNSGECTAQRGGIKPFYKAINADAFYPCLREYLETDTGSNRERDLIFSDEEDVSQQRINAFRISVDVKKIDSVAT